MNFVCEHKMQKYSHLHCKKERAKKVIRIHDTCHEISHIRSVVDGVKAQGEVTASWLNVCQVDLRFSDTHTHSHTYTYTQRAKQWSKQCQVIYDNALAAKTRRAAIKAKWLRPSQKSHINVKNLTIDASSSASCITSSCCLLRLLILKTSPVALCCSCSSLPPPLQTSPCCCYLLNRNSNEPPGNVSPCCCLCCCGKNLCSFCM